jgi:hypothetical protein
METLLSEFAAIIVSESNREYNVPGDRLTIRIEFLFIDQSRLVAYEMIFYDTGRTKYSYHWMKANNEVTIRWDNAHEVPGIPTSPHHQHIGSEENVQPSEPMTLGSVLTFIALQLTASD